MQEHERRLDQAALERLQEVVSQRVTTTRLHLRRPFENVGVVEERIVAAEVSEPRLEPRVVVPLARGARGTRPVAADDLPATHHPRHSPYAAIGELDQRRRRDEVGVVDRGHDRHQRPQVVARQVRSLGRHLSLLGVMPSMKSLPAAGPPNAYPVAL